MWRTGGSRRQGSGGGDEGFQRVCKPSMSMTSRPWPLDPYALPFCRGRGLVRQLGLPESQGPRGVRKVTGRAGGEGGQAHLHRVAQRIAGRAPQQVGGVPRKSAHLAVPSAPANQRLPLRSEKDATQKSFAKALQVPALRSFSPPSPLALLVPYSPAVRSLAFNFPEGSYPSETACTLSGVCPGDESPPFSPPACSNPSTTPCTVSPHP